MCRREKKIGLVSKKQMSLGKERGQGTEHFQHGKCRERAKENEGEKGPLDMRIRSFEYSFNAE